MRREREESEERERRKRYHQDTAGSLKDLRKARLYHSQFISYNSFHALTTMSHDCHLWPSAVELLHHSEMYFVFSFSLEWPE